jgi:hypothetical protein
MPFPVMDSVVAARFPSGGRARTTLQRHDVKKKVAGCEVLGVRACCALHWRAGRFPILVLTIRTPML